jgi:hypothetical protein
MKENAVNCSPQKEWREPGTPWVQFQSVEFAIDGLACLHQFRIWNIMPDAMCVLVKEDAEILGRLKAGDILRLKYYTSDELSPTRYLDTEIRRIRKEDDGRFRGHYLVGLAILEELSPSSCH